MYDTKPNRHEHKHFWTRSGMGRVLALSALILGVSAFLLGLSTSGVLAGAPTAATSGPHLASPMPAKPLETLLNEDGTLNLASGFTGSLDPTGYRMATLYWLLALSVPGKATVPALLQQLWPVRAKAC